MRRDTMAPPGTQDRSIDMGAAVPPDGVSPILVTTEQASQRVALWMEQTLAAQMLAFRRLTDALQVAVDGLPSAQNLPQQQDARDRLLAVALEDLAHWQSETIDAWYSLQRDWARHTALLARTAAEKLMESLWRPQPPRMARTTPSHDAKAAPAGDDTFKAWERLWLPWGHGADAPSRA